PNSAKPVDAFAESNTSGRGNFPRHAVDKSLRVPSLILAQNAGKPCSDSQAAQYAGLQSYKGRFSVEIGSAIKYGFLSRPKQGTIEVTTLARKALRPQEPNDKIDAMREAILKAPDIGDVYKHYRGENLPDQEFLDNALRDKFAIPADKVSDFVQ